MLRVDFLPGVWEDIVLYSLGSLKVPRGPNNPPGGSKWGLEGVKKRYPPLDACFSEVGLFSTFLGGSKMAQKQRFSAVRVPSRGRFFGHFGVILSIYRFMGGS